MTEQRARLSRENFFPVWGVAALPAGVIIGVILGIIFGAFFGVPGIGASVGAAIGVSVGIAFLAGALDYESFSNFNTANSNT